MAANRILLSSVAGALLLVAVPVHADVKTGADAWARGDFAGAIKEWEGPAAAGDPDAQFNLAQAYKLGRGVARDLPKAELLFGKAAAKGHVQAADNYGLLLFDRGERVQALPYIRSAADRGDPRAQYLMGISHFNGDIAPKDWVRAYALMTMAQGAGLPQAAPALAQMDQYIPMAQRQAGASLATQLGQQAEAARASQLASLDLGVNAPASAVPAPVATAAPRPETAVSSAARTAANDSPATAGADFARPAVAARPASAPLPKPFTIPRPVTAPVAQTAAAPKAAAPLPNQPVAKPAAAPAAAAPRLASGGAWRVQLGAFSVPANADALWAKVRGRPEIAGHARIDARAGRVVKLQAGGFASRDAAASACAGLTRAGLSCLPTQD